MPGLVTRHAARGVALAAALLLFAFAPRGQANDASFGGAGARLVPMSNSQVEMQSEDIELVAHHDSWDVRAKYVFLNHGSEPITLQVGFPELRCEVHADCSPVRFRGLRTTVAGKPVRHREGKLADEQPWSNYLGVVWLFDVTFAPNTPLTIEHSYSMGSGENVDGYRFTSYITKTGAGWKGSIGRARFVARLPAFTHVVEKRVPEGLQAQAPRHAADGMVEYVLEGTNWTPTEDVDISYNATLRGISYPHLDRLHWTSCFYASKLEADMVQRCKNLLYASKGYRFEKPELSAFFYGGNQQFREKDLGYLKGWARDLRPVGGFNLGWLEPSERRWLNEAEALQKAAGSGGPSLPPGALGHAAPDTTAATPTSTGERQPAPVPPATVRAPGMTKLEQSAPSAASTAPSKAETLPSTPAQELPRERGGCTLGAERSAAWSKAWILGALLLLGGARRLKLTRLGPQRCSAGCGPRGSSLITRQPASVFTSGAR